MEDDESMVEPEFRKYYMIIKVGDEVTYPRKYYDYAQALNKMYEVVRCNPGSEYHLLEASQSFRTPVQQEVIVRDLV